VKTLHSKNVQVTFMLVVVAYGSKFATIDVSELQNSAKGAPA
jgi:hypothetical protein